jgi:hypothetical protein
VTRDVKCTAGKQIDIEAIVAGFDESKHKVCDTRIGVILLFHAYCKAY